MLIAGLDDACIGREYRTRTDLHATERALVAAVAPLCGNSARGGFHQEPDLTAVGRVRLPPYDDPAAPGTVAALASINDAVEAHVRDARVSWEQERGAEPMSSAAFESALEYARVTRLVAGGVSHVRVAKDVPQEEFRSEDGRLGYFGERSGPGPAMTRTVLRAIYDAGQEVEDEAEVERHAAGAFFDY